MNIRARSILVASLTVAFLAGQGPGALGQDNLVRAKVGIQVKSDRSMSRAKAKETIRAGDMLRIYVQPESNASVYVIHSDQSTATLLNTVRQEREAVTLVMPSLQEFYQVDGNSAAESFTIVCSPEDIAEMAELVQKGQISHKAWAAIEEKLAQQGKIKLGTEVEKPFSLAGNVRGVVPSAGDESFAVGLPIFSGNGLLVKTYVFTVQN